MACGVAEGLRDGLLEGNGERVVVVGAPGARLQTAPAGPCALPPALPVHYTCGSYRGVCGASSPAGVEIVLNTVWEQLA